MVQRRMTGSVCCGRPSVSGRHARVSGQSGWGSWARMTTSARGGGGLSSTAVLLLSSVFSVGEVVVVVLVGERTACNLGGGGRGGES